jgi:hypothetical protein
MGSQKDKIYIDARQPATLIDGDKSIDCSTLGEAVIAYDNLPEPRKSAATTSAAVGCSPQRRLIGCTTGPARAMAGVAFGWPR